MKTITNNSLKKTFITLLVMIFFIPAVSYAQSCTGTANWSTGWCEICGGPVGNYACGPPWSGWPNWGNTQTSSRCFADCVPAGNIVTRVRIVVYKVDCGSAGLTIQLNGVTIGYVTTPNGCACNSCWPSTVDLTFPCGIPGYNYGGNNCVNLTIDQVGGTGTNTVCVDRAVYTLFYGPPTTANFTNNTVCLGTCTQFTNTSTPGTCSWSFGDGNTSTLCNPCHTYTTSGTKSVTLCVTSSSGCTQCTTPQNITVNAAPTVNAGPNRSICSGGSVTIGGSPTASGGSGTYTYLWSPSTGLSPNNTVANPSASPASSTAYTVTVTDVGGGGCTNSDAMVVTVNPSPIASAGPNQATCAGGSVVIGGSPTGSGGIGPLTYSWSPPTGLSNALAPNPTASPASTTTYTVTVTDINGCISNSDAMIVTINPNPVANFTAPSGCSVGCIQFTDQSTGSPAVSYSWNFGDTGTDTLKNPCHLYSIGGNYLVELTVTDVNGCTDVIQKSISVFPQPVADFGYTKECELTPTFFTDLSTIGSGSITGWDWDFGDAATDTIPNPSHLYGSYGNYEVTLIVTSDNGCQDTIVDSIEVFQPAIVDFSAITVCFGDSTQFTDLSTFTNSWNWDFGDAMGTSTLQDPSYLYGDTGTFSVTLISTTDSGCVATKVKDVTVNQNPVAGFTATNVCAGSPVQFTDTSSMAGGIIATWLWDFGDLNLSMQINPSHLYASADSFTVQLVVTADNSCADTAQQNIIVNPIPVADFSYSIACADDSTQFTDQSSVAFGSIAGWDWDFGDGGTSTLPNPGHPYNPPGNYGVTLTVTTAAGCTSGTITKIVPVDPNPVADFTAPTICFGDSTQFTDASSGNITGWNWEFGDANNSTLQDPVHYYLTSDTFTVQLVVTTDSACTDTIQKAIIVDPKPIADFSADTVCEKLYTQFTDLSSIAGDSITSWLWSFGDSTPFSVQQNPSHKYDSAGTFVVTLIVTTSDGCQDTVQNSVIVYDKPSSNFNFLNVCFGDTIFFTDASNAVPDSLVAWDWDFGDSTQSILPNPGGHFYADSAGGYVVQLIVETDRGCRDTLEKAASVFAPPAAAFDITWANGTECYGITTTFMNTTPLVTGGDTAYWDFGDATTAVGDTVNHLYDSAGAYTVQLISITPNGCSDTTNTVVIVNPVPAVDFSATTVCENGSSTQFTNLSTIGVPDTITTWEWNFGDGTPIVNDTNPTHNYTAGTFVVQLIVTTNSNCKDTVQDSVIVYPKPLAGFGVNTVCFEEANKFTNLNDTITSLWTFGDGDSSFQQHPLHQYASADSFTVQLIVTTNNGCEDDTSIVLNIAEPLTVNTIALCRNGGTAIAVASGGRPPYTYEWTLTGNPGVIPKDSVNEILLVPWAVVTVTDLIGCKITDSVSIKNDYPEDIICEIALTIFSGFSPNDDQANDYWIIEGINTAPENSVQIFNRWGDVVWEGSNYNNENDNNHDNNDGGVIWRGTNNKGGDLPDATYYYVIEIFNKALQQITIDGKPFFGTKEETWNNVERPLSDKAVISGWVEIMR
ncbi:MAG: PKD domain-containing protein [Cytophagales bacterium]|nr:PKD domain-containing protein [Cytophagales bacterium]